jgi:hypothetical protein
MSSSLVSSTGAYQAFGDSILPKLVRFGVMPKLCLAKNPIPESTVSNPILYRLSANPTGLSR